MRLSALLSVRFLNGIGKVETDSVRSGLRLSALLSVRFLNGIGKVETDSQRIRALRFEATRSVVRPFPEWNRQGRNGLPKDRLSSNLRWLESSKGKIKRLKIRD
ncbi:hypothetical protein PAEVO_25340 [Paenibacillus sp. GM2FR]|nr:hypothetical protein PAEVO_25340 [Paenibacillus sp. GM2FR]